MWVLYILVSIVFWKSYAQNCVPTNNACSGDVFCCRSQLCLNGTCTNCDSGGGACTVNTTCCSRDCNNKICTRLTVCNYEGQTCSGNTVCCNYNNYCKIPTNGSTGVCTRVPCSGGGLPCTNNTECCAGQCRNGTCCGTGLGGHCTSDSFCCGDSYIECSYSTGSGICRNKLGGYCPNNQYCASGICHNGACCTNSGYACSASPDCCFTPCTNGTCCTPNGGSCPFRTGCCSGHCNNGTCGEIPQSIANTPCPVCIPNGVTVACLANADCCSGICNSSRRCSQILMPLPAACVPNGESCDDTQKCCGLNFCSNNRCCGSTLYEACQRDSDCCSGRCMGVFLFMKICKPLTYFSFF